MKEKGFSDFISGFLLMIFSLLILWESMHTAHVLWPMFVLTIILICSIVLIKQGFLNLKIFRRNIEKDDFGGDKDEKRKWLRFSLMAGLHFIYYIALHWIGFLISTPIFIAIAMLMLGERNKMRVIIFSFFTSLFFAFLFIYLLHVSPPKGVSLMKDFSSLFY